VTTLKIGKVDHLIFTLWTFNMIHIKPRISCKEIKIYGTAI